MYSEDTAHREAMKRDAELYAFRFEAYAIEREMRRAREREQWLTVTLPAILRRAARDRMLAEISN